MEKPVLVIMAAGMGSRYGGRKQIDPIDDKGHLIIDFSIYDAIKAGFKKIVFIIKKKDEEDFKEIIGNRISKQVDVSYAYQELDYLPEGFFVPDGRTKPFGTGHAILCCENVVDGPFGVINADDYYGAHAFQILFDSLSQKADDKVYQYSMIGYKLKNTLTDHGHVARGVCEIDDEGYLLDIKERTHIEKRDNHAAYLQEDDTWADISVESIVSMNMWGFSNSILKELKNRFPIFLNSNIKSNPLKCEFFLPSVVDELLKEDKARVQVQISPDKWYGVTYKEDKAVVVSAIQKFKEQGLYPEKLWEE